MAIPPTLKTSGAVPPLWARRGREWKPNTLPDPALWGNAGYRDLAAACCTGTQSPDCVWDPGETQRALPGLRVAIARVGEGCRGLVCPHKTGWGMKERVAWAPALLLVCSKATAAGTRWSQADAGLSRSRMTTGLSGPCSTPELRQLLSALSWRFSGTAENRTAPFAGKRMLKGIPLPVEKFSNSSAEKWHHCSIHRYWVQRN